MATYVITDREELNWSDENKYKHRYESSNGLPTAQAEMDRRRTADQPGVLWRWENGEATVIDRC